MAKSKGSSITKTDRMLLKEKVRSLMIIDPRYTSERILDMLRRDKNLMIDPGAFGLKTIRSLMREIKEERTQMIATANIYTRLVGILDKKHELEKMLWREATNPNNTPAERIAASRLLIELDLKVLQAEMDAGVYARHLGVVHHAIVPVGPDKKEKIMQALQARGLIDASQDEIKRIIDIDPEEVVDVPMERDTKKNKTRVLRADSKQKRKNTNKKKNEKESKNKK